MNKSLDWLLKMAWRDSRRNRWRLLLFISSIIIGIAALVAINSFGENLQRDIQQEAKSLLGADLQLETTRPPSDSLQFLLDSLGGEQASSTHFISMSYFPRTEDSRLSYIRALEGNYPFYGNIGTEPKSAYADYQKGQKALVDNTMMIQFGLTPGDTIRVGKLKFEIAGSVYATPGQSGISSSIAPVVYIPKRYLPETGLIQKGSRIEYNYYFSLVIKAAISEQLIGIIYLYKC